MSPSVKWLIHPRNWCEIVLTTIIVSIVLFAGYVAADKATYPDLGIDAAWASKLKALDVSKLSQNERGALLVESLLWPLDRELHSYWGYTPNDIMGLQWFDNRANRQANVVISTSWMLRTVAFDMSSLGDNDPPDADFTKAAGYLMFNPYEWGRLGWNLLPAGSAEENYTEALTGAQKYIARLLGRDPKQQATFNMTPCDLAVLFNSALTQSTKQQYGLVVETDTSHPWSKIDDDVYAMVGAVIPVYYMAYTINAVFPDMISPEAKPNMDKALEAMRKVVHFNPSVVLPGSSNGDGLVPDHRANIARLVSDVRHRLQEVTKSIPTGNCR